MVQLKWYKKRKTTASEIPEGFGTFESLKNGRNVKTKIGNCLIHALIDLCLLGTLFECLSYSC